MNIKKGFTLVELLIVIGLLGAIALIVISAINPIEQSNRARDTKYKADAGQFIGAIDRYFVTQDEFPWTTFDSVTYPSADTAVSFASATLEMYGLCGATCTADGLLIGNNELKTEFRSRDFIKGTPTVPNQIWIGKELGSSESTYACFVPLSKSIRDKACNDGKVYTLSGSTRTLVSGATCLGTAAGWSASPYMYVCLPE
jgi:prepilin-type N-terminal cleavage/methylation domain-containing protein